MTTQPNNPTSNILSQALAPILARRTLLAAAVSALCAGAAGGAAPAKAQPPGAPLLTVQVVDRETGQVAQVWRHAGKLYVAGQPGARYGLRVTNNSGGRILAVMSVDGVNILTGETAAYGQRGYVFGPYETYDINGWRKSNYEVAAFNFAPLEGSYAARTGRPDDVGVIGVAAFRERVYAPPPPPPPPPPSPPMSVRRAPAAADMAPPPLPIPPVEHRVETPAPPPALAAAPAGRAQAEASAVAPAAKLGTGHGALERSYSSTVAFERASSSPQFVYRVEYDSRARLIASGVIPRPLPVPRGPSPFPANRNGFVPDPPYDG